jgi:hypothetical protein
VISAVSSAAHASSANRSPKCQTKRADWPIAVTHSPRPAAQVDPWAFLGNLNTIATLDRTHREVHDDSLTISDGRRPSFDVARSIKLESWNTAPAGCDYVPLQFGRVGGVSGRTATIASQRAPDASCGGQWRRNSV